MLYCQLPHSLVMTLLMIQIQGWGAVAGNCITLGIIMDNYQLLDTVFIMDPFISHYHENFLAVIYDFEYKSLSTCHVSYLITSCITRFIFNKHFLFNWSICLKCKLCFQIELLQISYHYFRWKDKASNT